jgi:hypothetical protein
MTSLTLEVARAGTWIAIIVAGVLVLRASRWSRWANIICGGAFLFINGAKIIDGGFNIIDIGFASYGMALIAFFMLTNWRALSTAELEALDASTSTGESVVERREAA